MEIPKDKIKTENIQQIKDYIASCKELLSKYKMKPDSRMTKDDYDESKLSQEEFIKKKKNKYRVNYFQALSSYLYLILNLIPEIKEQYQKIIYKLLADINNPKIEGQFIITAETMKDQNLITEELINEMDALALEIIAAAEANLDRNK